MFSTAIRCLLTDTSETNVKPQLHNEINLMNIQNPYYRSQFCTTTKTMLPTVAVLSGIHSYAFCGVSMRLSYRRQSLRAFIASRRM